jgi:hypothetical protein
MKNNNQRKQNRNTHRPWGFETAWMTLVAALN